MESIAQNKLNRRGFLAIAFGAAVLPLLAQTVPANDRPMTVKEREELAAELCQLYRDASPKGKAQMEIELEKLACEMTGKGGDSLRDFTSRMVKHYGNSN